MAQSFKDRLKILMNGDRPYSWSKKVGIEKGLFQYYWQKEKIPTYENLLKIARYSGCSLQWLLTGREIDFEKVIPEIKGKDQRGKRLAETFKKLRKIYLDKTDADVAAVECIVNLIGKKR